MCIGNLLYAQTGQIVAPTDMALLGTCPTSGLVQPDPELGRVFFLTNEGPGRNEKPQVVICDQHTFTLLGSFEVPGFGGTDVRRGFVRWGQDGLAYRSADGQLFLVRSALVNGQP